MDLNKTDSSFTGLDIADYVAPVPDPVPVEGYVYLVRDDVFPHHVKIGKTTNMYKRLLAYNSDKPYPTARLHAISKLFTDVNLVEKKILEYLYSKASPTTAKREWFELKHLDMCEMIIKEAESHFECR